MKYAWCLVLARKLSKFLMFIYFNKQESVQFTSPRWTLYACRAYVCLNWCWPTATSPWIWTAVTPVQLIQFPCWDRWILLKRSFMKKFLLILVRIWKSTQRYLFRFASRQWREHLPCTLHRPTAIYVISDPRLFSLNEVQEGAGLLNVF